MRQASLAAAITAAFLVLFGTMPANAVVLGGKGAPQAEHCVSIGGTNVTSGSGGNMCELPSGQSCEAMALFRDGSCVDENGEVIDTEEEDFGTNDGSDTGGDSEGGGDSGGD